MSGLDLDADDTTVPDGTGGTLLAPAAEDHAVHAIDLAYVVVSGPEFLHDRSEVEVLMRSDRNTM